MDSRKRQKELLAKQRRMQVKSAESGGKSGNPQPVFQPVQRRDTSHDEMHKRAKNVLGDYHTVVESMNAFRDPSKFLGIDDNTPSTPVVAPKHNPFNTKFRSSLPTTASSSSTASTSLTASAVTTKGGSLSRHQVAEPPRTVPGVKKEKGAKHSKHGKMAAASKSTGGGTDGSSKRTKGDRSNGNKDSSRPTNVLVVPKNQKRGVVRPAKPVLPSPTTGNGNGTSLGQNQPPRQGSFDDLFKVDPPLGSDRSSAVVVGVKGPSKSRKAHASSQQAPPTSSLEPHPPNHSSISVHKSSNGINPLQTSTHGDVPSGNPSAHKLKKSSSATQLLAGGSPPSVGKDPSMSTDAKVVLKLHKTSSMDRPLSPRGLPPSHLGSERKSNIDIAQLRTLTFEPAHSENSNASSVSLPESLKGEKGRKEKRKKLKKVKKKEREGDNGRETEVSPMQLSLPGPPANTASLPLDAAPPASTWMFPPHCSHVTTARDHMTTSQTTTTSSRMHQASKQRPHNLHFESRTSNLIAEESVDSGDLQSMLKEMMPSVKSMVTPISTPKKNRPFDFSSSSFPLPPSSVPKPLCAKPANPLPPSSLASATFSSPTAKVASKRHPSHILSSTSSDEEGYSVSRQGVQVAMTILDRSLATESTDPTLRRADPPSSSGSSSEASDSSGSSSSDSSESSDEEESNGLSLEKIPLSLPSAITPLKTPPHVAVSKFPMISPLAEEQHAHVVPPIAHGRTPQDNSVYSQAMSYSQNPHISAPLSYTNQSFAAVTSHISHPLASATTVTSVPAPIMSDRQELPVPPTTDASTIENDLQLSEDSSSSESDDSGSESDTESSDSEDDQGAREKEDENTASVRAMDQQAQKSHGSNFCSPQGNEHLTVSFSSTGFTVPFSQEGDSTGFLESMGFFGGSGGDDGVVEKDLMGPEAGAEVKEHPLTFDDETQPFDASSVSHSVVKQETSEVWHRPSFAASKGKRFGGPERDAQRSTFSPLQESQGAQQQKGVSAGRKRKHKTDLTDPLPPEQQTPASKTPKLSVKAGQGLAASRQSVGEWSVVQSGSSPPGNRGTTLSSSISISDDVSSDSSSSSEEEEEEGMEEDSAFVEPPGAIHAPPPTSVAAVVRPAVPQEQASPSVKIEADCKMQPQLPLNQLEGDGDSGNSSLKVSIPLNRLGHQKPKAKVEPILQNPTPSNTMRRRATSDMTEHEEPRGSRRMSTERDSYGRRRDDEYYHRDGERGRPHSREGRWDPPRDRRHSGSDDLPPRGGSRRDRGLDYRERDRGAPWEYRRDRDWVGYYDYDDGRRSRPGPYHERAHSSEYYMQEARRRKHEADKIRTPGVEKAKAYMDSVIYFMRHGDMVEREVHQQKWDGVATKSPFKMYMDTVQMIKVCENMARDCKPLATICLRCLSVLHWKLFSLRQDSMARIQKELQEFFIPPKSLQKSPYPNSFSPLPSPASVGSTGSTGSCSGAMTSLSGSQDPSLSPSHTITVPRRIFNRATEHLSITSYINQSFETWRQSELLVEQCRDFFSQVDRKFGSRITQFSPIPHMADWVEIGLRALRWV